MTQITKGSQASGTLVLPETVLTVSEDAFTETQLLKSVILNEGLRVLESSSF